MGNPVSVKVPISFLTKVAEYIKLQEESTKHLTKKAEDINGNIIKLAAAVSTQLVARGYIPAAEEAYAAEVLAKDHSQTLQSFAKMLDVSSVSGLGKSASEAAPAGAEPMRESDRAYLETLGLGHLTT